MEGGEGRGLAGAASPVPPAPGPGGSIWGPSPLSERVRESGKKKFFFFFFICPQPPSEDGHCNEQYATQMVQGWWQGLGGRGWCVRECLNLLTDRVLPWR